MASSFHPYNFTDKKDSRHLRLWQEGLKGGLDEVAEQQSGLRFDIYERVHLNESARGIQELDEVELVPHIQVMTQGDQAILKGNLFLSGTYTSEREQEQRTLEHLIPVEISLPLNRIHTTRDLVVEIENFDVDVLSPRSLNVTGVLSLQGVEMVSVPADSWRSEEEVVFVHPPEEGRTEPVDESFQESQDSRYEPKAPPVQQAAQVIPPAVQAVPFPQPFPPYQAVAHQAAPQVPPKTAEPSAAVQEPVDIDVDLKVEETEFIIPEAAEEAGMPPDTPSYAEEKKELKVALGSKKVAELAEQKTYGIKSLLQKSSSVFLDKREESDAPVQETDDRTDAVEWKKLFLSSAAEGQEFRKLRMCIVQKEETLESIAKRYQVSPRELQLLNRLQEPQVAVGQVIYLPR
jgi:stage VI sporulation protein D